MSSGEEQTDHADISDVSSGKKMDDSPSIPRCGSDNEAMNDSILMPPPPARIPFVSGQAQISSPESVSLHEQVASPTKPPPLSPANPEDEQAPPCLPKIPAQQSSKLASQTLVGHQELLDASRTLLELPCNAVATQRWVVETQQMKDWTADECFQDLNSLAIDISALATETMLLDDPKICHELKKLKAGLSVVSTPEEFTCA